MANVFTIAAGALSVVILFNNCVDCFEYIQLGRHFDRDYQSCQLKLDVAKIRLSRWGEAVQLTQDPRFASDMPSEEPVQIARSTLQHILNLFQAAHQKSLRYKKRAAPEDLVLYDEENDLAPLGRRLHLRFKDLARRRHESTGLLERTRWALYDGKEFDRFIEDIKGFIDDLEELFPVGTTCRQLAKMEIEEIEDEPSLAALKSAAHGVDMALLEAAAHKGQTIASKNSADQVKAADSADVQIGNQYGEAALLYGIKFIEQSSNSAGTVDAKDTAIVHVGGRFGLRFEHQGPRQIGGELSRHRG